MTSVFDTPFSPNEIEYLKFKLLRFNRRGECYIWYGQTNRDGYPIIRVPFREKRRQTFTAHRLVFYLGNGCSFENAVHHVSHLCHNKKCIRLLHLSLEPSATNSNRNICRNLNSCRGHCGYRDCMFEDHQVSIYIK